MWGNTDVRWLNWRWHLGNRTLQNSRCFIMNKLQPSQECTEQILFIDRVAITNKRKKTRESMGTSWNWSFEKESITLFHRGGQRSEVRQLSLVSSTAEQQYTFRQKYALKLVFKLYLNDMSHTRLNFTTACARIGDRSVKIRHLTGKRQKGWWLNKERTAGFCHPLTWIWSAQTQVQLCTRCGAAFHHDALTWRDVTEAPPPRRLGAPPPPPAPSSRQRSPGRPPPLPGPDTQRDPAVCRDTGGKTQLGTGGFLSFIIPPRQLGPFFFLNEIIFQ